MLSLVLGAACSRTSEDSAGTEPAADESSPATGVGTSSTGDTGAPPTSGATDASTTTADAGTTNVTTTTDAEGTTTDTGDNETANRLLSWNDGIDVYVVDPGGESLDGYVRGGDFDSPIWASQDIWSWWMLHVVGTGNPLTDYARATIPTIVDRHGSMSSVLKMHLLADAPGTDVEQLTFEESQPPGVADTMVDGFTLVEPVFYQRQWIKFGPNTLARAESIGANAFYQIFWEMKAEPDYRLRVQLQYDQTFGLAIRAHDDTLSNADPLDIDSGITNVGPLVVPGDDSSEGWYLFEVFLDRTAGEKSRWRVRFNGVDVLDYTGPMAGASGNIINGAFIAQLYSDVTDLSTDPFYQHIDDIEIWDAPPLDAWSTP